MNRQELLEALSRLEHEQWVSWARSVFDEVSPERRERWSAMFVDYSELSEDVKELDRVWARKVLAALERLGAGPLG